MTPEKDSQLCEKYPKIFRDRYASPQSTCMCWGFSCGDGWYDLIDTLCSCIQNHVENKFRQQQLSLKYGNIKPEDVIPSEDLQVVAVQVKEKFGGLRFYINGADEEVHGMITMAEAMSHKICEDCGSKGTLRKGGWLRTLCDSCHDADQKRKHESWKSSEESK